MRQVQSFDGLRSTESLQGHQVGTQVSKYIWCLQSLHRAPVQPGGRLDQQQRLLVDLSRVKLMQDSLRMPMQPRPRRVSTGSAVNPITCPLKSSNAVMFPPNLQPLTSDTTQQAAVAMKWVCHRRKWAVTTDVSPVTLGQEWTATSRSALAVSLEVRTLSGLGT